MPIKHGPDRPLQATLRSFILSNAAEVPRVWKLFSIPDFSILLSEFDVLLFFYAPLLCTLYI